MRSRLVKETYSPSTLRTRSPFGFFNDRNSSREISGPFLRGVRFTPAAFVKSFARFAIFQKLPVLKLLSNLPALASLPLQLTICATAYFFDNFETPLSHSWSNVNPI